MNKCLALTVALAVLLVTCSNPRDSELSKLTGSQREALNRVLTAEEHTLLADYKLRHAVTYKEEIPAGITVDQALKEQVAWEARRNDEAARTAELKKLIDAERDAPTRVMLQAVNAAVISWNPVPAGGPYDLQISYALENIADKTVIGIKGRFIFTDTFGNDFYTLRFEYEEKLAPRHTVTRHTEVKNLYGNAGKLRTVPSDQVKVRFEPLMVVFQNGDKLATRD